MDSVIFLTTPARESGCRPARRPRAAEWTGTGKIVEAFLVASRGGDIATLLNLLAPDVVRTVDPTLVPGDVPTELRGAREVAEETRRFARRARAGAVLFIDGAPGILIAPHGRAQTLLRIGIGDDERIDTIDITGDTARIRSAVLALPSSNTTDLSGTKQVRSGPRGGRQPANEEQHAR